MGSYNTHILFEISSSAKVGGGQWPKQNAKYINEYTRKFLEDLLH